MFPRLNRLNGWQRIGVVASVVWAIVGAFWGYSIGVYQGGKVDRDYFECRWGAQNWYENQDLYQGTRRYTKNDLMKDLEKCGSEFKRAQNDAVSTGCLYAALMALLPIPFTWFAVYKSIALLKWIREGFRT